MSFNPHERSAYTFKCLNMEIIGDGGEKVSGVWTGGVKTKVKNSYLTIPILAKYKLTKRYCFEVLFKDVI